MTSSVTIPVDVEDPILLKRFILDLIELINKMEQRLVTVEAEIDELRSAI